jgi:hypothetical protein
VGSLGFGKSSERVIEGDFHSFVGPKPIRSSGHHSNLIVETLDGTAGNLCFGTEPVRIFALTSCTEIEEEPN